jgi:protein-S-isoprenylcysteine O-methyltransferase Ste14
MVWQLVVRPAEEADLTQRFGDTYQHYCQHVHGWLPLSYYRFEKTNE